VAVAVHLLDPAVSATPIAPVESETNETEAKEEPQNSQDTGGNVSQIQDDLRCGPRCEILTDLVFRHFNRWHQLPLLPK
jgi:hypothetical protein